MAEQGHTVEVDSLVANEFEVRLEDETLAGVFRVEGLTTFKLDENGKRLHEPFRLVKMVQQDGNNAFNRWLRETQEADNTRPRRTVAILAMDEGVETRRWTVYNAWISEVTYSTFDSAAADMVEEIVTIQYEMLEESWPTSENGA